MCRTKAAKKNQNYQFDIRCSFTLRSETAQSEKGIDNELFCDFQALKNTCKKSENKIICCLAWTHFPVPLAVTSQEEGWKREEQRH